MRKKLLSLALALVMCLGLTVPAFAAESKWKLEVPGKSNAEIFVGKKTFTLRDCGTFGFEYGGELSFYKEDDLQWTTADVCVLAKGDTAVFTYDYKTVESTNHGGLSGSSINSFDFTLMAWSDPDGDGVYDRRAIIGDTNVFGNKEKRYCDLLPENCFEEVLPAGIDINEDSSVGWYHSDWSALVGYDEELRYEARLSADRVLEQFGPNTLIWIFDGTHVVGKSPDWSIFVESKTSESTVGGFTDVKKGDYFAEPVKWAVEKGITSGTSKTTFSPNSECSVAQILTFLWRANGSPKPSGSNPFTDVKSGDYYAEAAVWAYEKGMVSGTTFGGNAPCTRSMAVTYMWKAAGSPSAKAASFTDVSAGAEYASAVAWAVERGVTAGTSATTFSPDSICTRGQIVTFLYRGLAKSSGMGAQPPATERPVVTELKPSSLANQPVLAGKVISYADLVLGNPQPVTSFSPDNYASLESTALYMLKNGLTEFKVDYNIDNNKWLVTAANEAFTEKYGDICVGCGLTASGDGSFVLTVNVAGGTSDCPALKAAVKVHDDLWASGAITSSMTQKQKARVYYDWLIKHCEYDDVSANATPDANLDGLYEILFGGNSGFAEGSEPAEFALIEGKAVCLGYAHAYNLLLRLEGIECVTVVCELGRHAWSAVVLDGMLYHIDTTWGDTTGAPDRYFCMTEAAAWARFGGYAKELEYREQRRNGMEDMLEDMWKDFDWQ